jgi:hypothetical protein
MHKSQSQLKKQKKKKKQTHQKVEREVESI